MNGTFGVSIRCGAVLKFDGKSGAEVARLQAAGAKREAGMQYGSFGIGRGGLDVKAALFWAFVSVPLAWGVYKTLESVVKIF